MLQTQASDRVQRLQTMHAEALNMRQQEVITRVRWFWYSFPAWHSIPVRSSFVRGMTLPLQITALSEANAGLSDAAGRCAAAEKAAKENEAENARAHQQVGFRARLLGEA
jgi:hypothetical protein